MPYNGTGGVTARKKKNSQNLNDGVEKHLFESLSSWFFIAKLVNGVPMVIHNKMNSFPYTFAFSVCLSLDRYLKSPKGTSFMCS